MPRSGIAGSYDNSTKIDVFATLQWQRGLTKASLLKTISTESVPLDVLLQTRPAVPREPGLGKRE